MSTYAYEMPTKDGPVSLYARQRPTGGYVLMASSGGHRIDLGLALQDGGHWYLPADCSEHTTLRDAAQYAYWYCRAEALAQRDSEFFKLLGGEASHV